MALEGDIYRAYQNRQTLRFTNGTRAYFAKLHAGVGWRYIFAHILRLKLPPVGSRLEVHALRHLEKAGISTVKIAGYGYRKRKNPARLKSFIITEVWTASQNRCFVIRIVRNDL